MRNGKNISANTDQIADFLGWFSIGLGAAEVIAPRALGRLIGIKANPGLVRLFGLREIAAGIGILSQQRKDLWLKARVAGDALDLAALGAGMAQPQSSKAKAALATAAVAGVTALDIFTAAQVSKRPFAKGQPVIMRKAITVNRPPADVYRFWRNFEQLPQFMAHLESVRDLGNNKSHWKAKGPGGTSVEWDAEITEDQPDRLLAWRSLPGADVDNSGEVRFEPASASRGTVLRVMLRYNPPAGKMGALVAKLLGQAPEKQIAVDLMRFRQLLEAGEIARTEGQPAGRKSSTSKKYDDLVRA
ncbi:MAG TPA: SRPBCC family protein [Candidatus Dormibacteraeota bacterium]|nr:SRPBCC family protein [Candidatus Dormibacteraeota bacterium]